MMFHTNVQKQVSPTPRGNIISNARARGARTVRATAAAVGPEAARRGAWLGAPAPRDGHRARRRGARGRPQRVPGKDRGEGYQLTRGQYSCPIGP